ncbi:MAG: thiamine pyrophosphate-dependent enzyme [Desulfobacteria bacterium]|nr:thiamine pyrophosphate-dependent enzyme [Deltaproteobacteria bacterium]HQT97175.1 thiamine pyrophosphate-dependent enzyme [Thermodesulfobacteriota bacterium]
MAQTAKKQGGRPAQVMVVQSGNEIAATAAKQINYHVMGYYPITPSTEIAETLDAMKAEGEHAIRMVPGDGEHGAAGICFGASTGGGRVFNATSANGLLFGFEQLPVQSGERFPMVFNIVTRAVSGPLDIRGDHSDIMYAMNTGWIILMAADAQAVYDMNVMAPRIGEEMSVRLPVMVAFDGFFTSHQKRRVEIFADDATVQEFLGPFVPTVSSLDMKTPVTIGPYMNDPDQINNKKQQADAIVRSYDVIKRVFADYEALSGRRYDLVEGYRMEDADAALFILNSAAETAKEAVDALRKEGLKVGLIRPNVIRPFPVEEVRALLKNVKGLVVADRQDNFGAWGGAMAIEVKAALQGVKGNVTQVAARVFGTGGKEFFVEDAAAMLREALEIAGTGAVKVPYAYFGVNPGDPSFTPAKAFDPITEADASGLIRVETTPEGKMEVKGNVLRNLTERPKRIGPGHGACPGCGIFVNMNTFMKGIEGHVVILFHTGCGMVVTTGYPYTAHKITYIHNLFQNGAATLSGVVEMFEERKSRGEIPKDEKITFIMVTGDGGHDIGMGPSIGAAMRGHRMIICEYDNQGYQNTGSQLSFTVPLGQSTSTSNYGPHQHGKATHHKDTAQIFAACHVPYVCTVAESNPRDMIRKAAKAQKYADQGLVFVKMISMCPLAWKTEERMSVPIIQASVDCCFFPLYEVEHGITTISYDPEEKGKKVPVTEWLKHMGKTKHMLKPDCKPELDRFQAEVDRRWVRLKEMHKNPLL